MRTVRMTVVVALLLPALVVAAQEPPAIDRTDPTAVAKAYVEACRAGDVEGVLALIGPDDPTRAAVTEAARQFREGMQQAGFTPMDFFTEFLFLPLRIDAPAEAAGTQVNDAAATVRFTRNFVVQQQILLERAADGTWSVKPVASVKATTGGKQSFMEMQATRNRGAGSEEPGIWASHNRLRRLQQACEEYARDHDNRLPPAGTWMDALELYVLDPEAFKCPAAPDVQYGYAMNAAMGEQALPQDWGARRALLLLFEWPGGQRNASAMPEELGGVKSPRPDGSIAVVDATGNTRAIQEGTNWDDLALEAEQSNTCQRHLGKLTDAARKFARDNDGRLPGADTWEADVALYLMGDTEGDGIYRCPAAPELDYAYAINEEVAGKDAKTLPGHDSLILFFESGLNVPNATGLPQRDAPAAGRHIDEWNGGRTNNVAYLSGTLGSQPALAANP